MTSGVTVYDMAGPMSIRLSDEGVTRLRSQAAAAGVPPTTLAQRYVEEGLRMDAHPLIHFDQGPVERRASLMGGPDVCEAVAVLRANDGDVHEAATVLAIPPRLMQAAAAYYAAYPDEIDRQIQAAVRAYDEGYRAWQAGRGATGAA